MLKESLHIYALDGEGGKVPFPSEQEPAVLSQWAYTARRMAGAPVITATLMHRLCLDDIWTRTEFVELGGERYYVDQTPKSSKSTGDVRYRHDITLVSERIALENVYLFDVVTDSTEDAYRDRYRSNSTDVRFSGTLHEFVSRLNDSLVSSGLYDTASDTDYRVVIDQGVPVGDVREVSLTDVFFATALQEIYNKFGMPYYWVGKTCHVGYTQNAVITPLEYGSGKGLLSVSRDNQDYRIINRVTGTGSSENIPYYYPNENEYGTLVFSTDNLDRARVRRLDYQKIRAYNPAVYGTYTYCTRESEDLYIGNGSELMYYNPLDAAQKAPGTFPVTVTPYGFHQSGSRDTVWDYKASIDIYFRIHVKKYSYLTLSTAKLNYSMGQASPVIPTSMLYMQETGAETGWVTSRDKEQLLPLGERYSFHKDAYMQLALHGTHEFHLRNSGEAVVINVTPKIQFTYQPGEGYSRNFFLYGEGDKEVAYADSGIFIEDVDNAPAMRFSCALVNGEMVDTPDEATAGTAAEITITDRRWINPTGALMPAVYRESMGAERFYNALNGTYLMPDGETLYTFNNPYTPGKPMEGIASFDDIKPTIQDVRNAAGLLLGEVTQVAFDADDSDETVAAGSGSREYRHSYFYVRLNVFDGDYGFNLFRQALESGAMTFNFTSGNCAGCAFEVVTPKAREEDGRYVFDNPVVTDDDGNLLKVQDVTQDGYTGDYIRKEGGTYTPRQQDTSKYPVWVALRKENSTYGVVMPNASANCRPQAGDTFVITDILMPQAYIIAAEKRLEEELIRYMAGNNDEKFTFSMQLSRIYLQNHPEVEAALNENSRIVLRYNAHDYTLYVSSFSCKVTDDVLAEITVDVTDAFSVGQTMLRDKVVQAVNDEMGSISDSVMAVGTGHFLSKTQDDNAAGTVTFRKAPLMRQGAVFGEGDIDTAPAAVASDGAARMLSLALVGALQAAAGNAGIGPGGEAWLRSLLLSADEGLKTDDFTAGTSGTGFAMLKKDALGKSYLEIDRLFVRMSAIFTRLEIRSLRYSGGNFVFSPAGAQVRKVEKVPAMAAVTDEDGKPLTDETYVYITADTATGTQVFRCWLNTDDGTRSVVCGFEAGDLVRAQDFNIREGAYQNVSNTFWWRRCVAVGPDFIDLSLTDCAPGSGEPQDGDEMVVMGNDLDPERQNVIIINTVGETAPEFVQYEGVSGYSLDGKTVTRISPKGNVFKGTFLVNTGEDLEAGLANAGIDITHGRIKVTADQFEVVNSDGETTAGVNSSGVLETHSMVAHDAALTGSFSCGGGVTAFEEDGSGQLAGGSVSWDAQGWWRAVRPPVITWLNAVDIGDVATASMPLPMTSGYINLTTYYNYTSLFTLQDYPYDVKLVLKYNGALTANTVCAALAGSFTQMVQKTAALFEERIGNSITLLKANVEFEITYTASSKRWHIPGNYKTVSEWAADGDILLV